MQKKYASFLKRIFLLFYNMYLIFWGKDDIIYVETCIFLRKYERERGGIFLRQRTYIAIDLKSFYASVECRERGLDPLDANLVVADEGRTDKTICLAVTPSLKSYGISGRGRLFEVRERVCAVNEERRQSLPEKQLSGASYLFSELSADPRLAADFIIAPPRMALYMEYSTWIYEIYLKYIAPEDIIVYSIDEVFIDVTDYLRTYGLRPRELAMKIILDILNSTGITATAGIGTNLFLCKVAMDIVAKHITADENGVRIAELDEMSFRQELWQHRPITDFWRVGRGYAAKLEQMGIFTMGDLARCSVDNEKMLYDAFGKNAELLIDHAWGWEPCTVDDINGYRPMDNSVSSGQVLQNPYDFEKAELVLCEMADLLALDLVDKRLATDQLVVTIGYDVENLSDEARRRKYNGEITVDAYDRRIPKHAHGTVNLGRHTSSAKRIIAAAKSLYGQIADSSLLIRRLNITANHIHPEASAPQPARAEQLSLLSDVPGTEEENAREDEREKKVQEAELAIKKKYGKNAILKGMNLCDGATARDRNRQIGGHKA